MSVTMSRAEGVAVFTLTSDPQSRWPPLCQILKALCYSPACCSLSPALRGRQRPSLSILGAMQIMIGFFNMGLGGILRATNVTDSILNRTEFPYWLGALFIALGVICILSERFPSLCLVILNVMVHLAGAALAVAAIVLYSVYMSLISVEVNCRHRWVDSSTLSPGPQQLAQSCQQGEAALSMIVYGMNSVLILLSVLELCVVLSCVVLGVRALRSSWKDPNQSQEDPEGLKPGMEVV
ncbi:uncharacterized protein ACNS7B_019545 isoform 1-T2 [Menidia menidia]